MTVIHAGLLAVPPFMYLVVLMIKCSILFQFEDDFADTVEPPK